MELTVQRWDKVKRIFTDAFNSSFYFSVATVNRDGSPHVTPIGSLILQGHNKGFFFEEYASTLSKNLQHNKRVCVMAVNSSKWLLLKSLVLGRFLVPPGVRLMGNAAERREATPQELDLFKNRVKKYRMFKGHDLLWSNLRYVREIHFDSYEPVRIGPLTRSVWNE